MGATSDKLTYLLDTKRQIKEAIIEKGVSVNEGESFRSYADKIRGIPQETAGLPERKDLNFYDYDGTILYSYSAAEVATMVELPEGPQHEGLVFDGWSSTLDEVKNYISQYGRWGVGAYFETDDNTARLYISLTDENRLEIPFSIFCRWGYAGTVDWGDGVVDKFSGEGTLALRHTYSKIGDYVIRFKHTSGDRFGLSGLTLSSSDVESSYYFGIIRKVEMCKSIYLSSQTFSSCRRLETITFASTQPTVNSSFDVALFKDCVSLKHICAMMSYGATGCVNCKSLKVAIFRVSGTSGNTTEINFEGCSALEEVYTVGLSYDIWSFKGCTNLKHPVTTSTTIMGHAFEGCESLRRLHNAVNLGYNSTNFKGGQFTGCINLEHIDLKSGTTELDSAFNNCRSLDYLVIPKEVTSIKSKVFMNCASLRYIDFSNHTSVPTLSSTDSFTGVSPLCKVYIPPALVNSWKAAAQWNALVSFLTPAIDIVECTSLTLVGNDISGKSLSTKATFTATVNGYNPLTGEYMEGVTYVDEVEISVPRNPSQTESVEREISYEFYGVTASATIVQSPYVEHKIVCKYNVTDTTTATRLLYSSYTTHTTDFIAMYIDGVEYPVALSHQFDTIGEHEVAFEIASDNGQIDNPYRLFYQCSRLVYVDCTQWDMSNITSTSTSGGTSYMFYQCSGLKTIILPDTIKRLGYYMFRLCTDVTNLTIKAATAPAVYGGATWGDSSYYIGYTNRAAGTNKLYVPAGATGYDTGTWTSTLQSTTYCGFTKEEVEF